jgi:putative SbcD/Mre11-related phosphoesterase
MLREPEWLLTPYRAVVQQPTATGIIADLHLGYAAARQASGEAVPELGEQILCQRVLRLLDSYRVQRLIIAGDLVEHGKSGHAAARRFVAMVRKKGVSVVLVPGNHDRNLPDLPGLERISPSLMVGTWKIIHQTENTDEDCCILGHLHPVIRSPAFSGQVPCYLLTERRLLLPAQSEDAFGGNVLTWKEWRQAQCHAIVKEELLALGSVAELREQLQTKR